MKIRVICVGKVKEKFYRDAIAEYMKRLSKYCKPEILEVQDEKTPDGASAAQEEQIRDKEGERILAKIQPQDYVIALAIQGKMLDSKEMSTMFDDLALHGKSSVCLIIGGSLGLSRQVLSRADYQLSFSKMTFPHQLMRVILLEQIYRSFKISHKEPYHK